MWGLCFLFLLKGFSINGEVVLPDFLPGTATYTAADGYWDNSALWRGTQTNINNGLPARQQDCAITGTSTTIRVDAQHVVSSVQAGFYLGDSATLVVSGSSADLLALTTLSLGEYAYSHTSSNSSAAVARLYVYPASKVRGSGLYIGPIRSQRDTPLLTGLSQGIVRVFGGRVAFQDMFIAIGVKAKGTLEINGSTADSIEVQNYLQMGTAETLTDADGDTVSAIKFIIDSQGVTPITIHNSTAGGGLRLDLNRPAEMESKNIRNLVVSIAAGSEPPSGNITLIDCGRPIRGKFYNLDPAAGDLYIYATSSGGKEYRWTLNYTGGADGNDLVLEAPQRKDNGLWTEYTAGGSQKSFVTDPTLWDFPAPPAVTFAGVKAFPTAEGFGAHSKGGRGGTVYHVTTLEDLDSSGKPVAGSLRAAVETNGARTIVFDVGGIIILEKALQIKHPFLTIAGQTAPGDGICITGNNVMLNRTHDVVVRYLRFRPGLEESAPDGDALSIHSSYNCIIDHCSMSWSLDEILSITGLADLCTVQWCILSEPLNFAGHGYLSILGGERSTWSHNLIAHINNRLPMFYGVCRVDWRDNVVYNWNGSGYGAFAGANFVNNWYKCGTNTAVSFKLFHNGRTFVKNESIFIQHNVMAEQNSGSLTRILITNICDNTQDGSTATGNNWNGMGQMDESSRASNAGDALSRPYDLLDDTYALHAYAIVPAYSGDNKNNGAIVRDATDTRIVNEFKYGTGAIKNEPPGDTLISDYTGSSPTDSMNDTDRDGMPNSWEYARTSPPSNTSLSSNADRDGDGYTNLEEYLNSLVTQNH
jgi:hypothetical protein